MIGIGLFARSACIFAIGLGLAAPAFAASTIVTTYGFNGSSEIGSSTCGAAGEGQSCYPGDSMTGLSGACSMLEGASTTAGGATTQELYILETGTEAAPVVRLNIYKKTVTIGAAINTNIVLRKSVIIRSLKGGSNLTCFMAANAGSIFLGTSSATHAVQFNRKTLVGQPFGQGLPPGKLTAMSANEAGDVTVYFSSKNNQYFYVFGPDGKNVELGGASGNVFVPNRVSGLSLN